VYGGSTSVPTGWIVIDSRSDPLSGLRGIVYQNVLDPSRIAVAIAGTQFTNGGTLDTDGAILGNNFPQRFNDELRALLDSIGLMGHDSLIGMVLNTARTPVEPGGPALLERFPR